MNIINECCRSDDKNVGIVIVVIVHIVTSIFLVLITSTFFGKTTRVYAYLPHTFAEK